MAMGTTGGLVFNWRERPAMLRCGTCQWWVTRPGSQIGRCRKQSPGRSGLIGWPSVNEQDFCGDHLLGDRWVPQSASEEA